LEIKPEFPWILKQVETYVGNLNKNPLSKDEFSRYPSEKRGLKTTLVKIGIR